MRSFALGGTLDIGDLQSKLLRFFDALKLRFAPLQLLYHFFYIGAFVLGIRSNNDSVCLSPGPRLPRLPGRRLERCVALDGPLDLNDPIVDQLRSRYEDARRLPRNTKTCDMGQKRKKRSESDMWLFSGEFKKEDMDDEKYPPLFKFNVIWNVRLRFAVEIKSNLQITSVPGLVVVIT